MAHEIRLQDGTIVKWLKNEGDPIREGEALPAVPWRTLA
jgi:pyruvate/2-oxoglutarate dehydrogenase complex dihydrolipoamide acyltransferase (E2) component